MSYILDALKKSEQKRQQGSVPDLLTVHDRKGLTAPKRVRLLRITIAVLLPALGVALWRITAPPHEKARPQVAPLSSSQSAALKKAPPQEKHITEKHIAHSDAQVSPSREPVAEAPPPSKQITFKEQELPSAIQQELPRPEISAHIYDTNAAARIISIHGNVIHEGEFVAPGLRLESITPDGVILSYKKYRFFRPLF